MIRPQNFASLTLLYGSEGLLKYHRAVKYVGLYTLLGYLVVIICYLAVWCHPITAYWAVPISECKAPTRSR